MIKLMTTLSSAIRSFAAAATCRPRSRANVATSRNAEEAVNLWHDDRDPGGRRAASHIKHQRQLDEVSYPAGTSGWNLAASGGVPPVSSGP
jgi:hypothetical protein